VGAKGYSVWSTCEGSGPPSRRTCITLADLLMPCKANSLFKNDTEHVCTHFVGKTPSSLNGKPDRVLLPAHRISMYVHRCSAAKGSVTSPHTVVHLLFVFCDLRFLDEPQFSLPLCGHFLHSINSANIFRRCFAIFTYLEKLYLFFFK